MKGGGGDATGSQENGVAGVERNSVNFTAAVRATTETLRSSQAYPVDFDEVDVRTYATYVPYPPPCFSTSYSPPLHLLNTYIRL